MDTLLIIGAETMLGANLAASLSEPFDVHALTCAPDNTLPAGVTPHLVGELTLARIRPLLAGLKPQWVLHAGALARSSWESPTGKNNWGQEITLAGGLAALAQETKCPFTFLSTDAVFAGPRLFHEESARATAASPLAMAAREAEAAVAAAGGLAVRTHAYGWGTSQEDGDIDQLWRQIAQQQRPAGESRHYATPILATDLAGLLVRAYERKLTGLYHITGAERTNRIRFAAELAAATGCQIEQRSPLSLNDTLAGPIVETSLNTRRARRELDLPMPLLREGLERLAAQRMNGFLDRLRATKGKSTAGSQAA